MHYNGGRNVVKQIVTNLNNLPIPVIHVSGCGEERGYQYGVQAKNLIIQSLKVYRDIVTKLRPDIIGWEAIQMEAKKMIPAIKRYDKELYLEIKGIAQGAQRSIEEIVFLNARSEIMNPAWANVSVHEGCTTFALGSSWNSDQSILLGQTYDWNPECAKQLVLYLSCDEEGLEFATITEAGIIGKVGCNNYGIANLLNYLNNYDVNPHGTIYNVLLRRMLGSKSIYEAQRNLLRSPIAFGLNVLLADTNGYMIDYELTAQGTDFFFPNDDYLLHTNHYLSDKLSLRRFYKDAQQESVTRYETAEHFLYMRKGSITVDDLMQLAAYHSCDQLYTSICRHGFTDAFGMETIFTIIMDLTYKKMYICIGIACKHQFYEIPFELLFTSYTK